MRESPTYLEEICQINIGIPRAAPENTPQNPATPRTCLGLYSLGIRGKRCPLFSENVFWRLAPFISWFFGVLSVLGFSRRVFGNEALNGESGILLGGVFWPKNVDV